MQRPFVGLIECSPPVADKIARKHGVTFDEVREAAQWPAQWLRASWLEGSDDPRGPRLAIEAATYVGRVLRIILYPVDVDQGTWRLGTAVPLA